MNTMFLLQRIANTSPRLSSPVSPMMTFIFLSLGVAVRNKLEPFGMFVQEIFCGVSVVKPW